MTRPRLSWNMADDGVVVIYATDHEGRVFDLCDIWRKPAIEKGCMTKEAARAFQVAAAERICMTWNEESDCKAAEGHLNSEKYEGKR